MKSKKVWLSLMIILLMTVWVSSMAFSQAVTQEQGPPSKPQEGLKVTIEGKILYLKSFGGYVVISETPHEEYKIINENPKLLGNLAKQGKPVKIEGRLPRGAYLLFIEKIDGKSYQGVE